MKQDDFLAQLESRLEENKQLSRGGLPRSWRFLGSIIGLHPWQSLLLISWCLTLGLFLIFRHTLMVMIEYLLLINPSI